MKKIVLAVLCVAVCLSSWAGESPQPVVQDNGSSVNVAGVVGNGNPAPTSVYRFMQEHNVTPDDNLLVKGAPRRQTAEELLGKRLISADTYDFAIIERMGETQCFVFINPVPDGGWLSELSIDEETGLFMARNFLNGLDVPIYLNEDATAAVIEPSVVYCDADVPELNRSLDPDRGRVDTDSLGESTTLRLLHDTVTTVYVLPEAWVIGNGSESINGTVYDDGSICFEDGFIFGKEVCITSVIYDIDHQEVLSCETDTTWEYSPIFRNTYLLAPNGEHRCNYVETDSHTAILEKTELKPIGRDGGGAVGLGWKEPKRPLVEPTPGNVINGLTGGVLSSSNPSDGGDGMLKKNAAHEIKPVIEFGPDGWKEPKRPLKKKTDLIIDENLRATPQDVINQLMGITNADGLLEAALQRRKIHNWGETIGPLGWKEPKRPLSEPIGDFLQGLLSQLQRIDPITDTPNLTANGQTQTSLTFDVFLYQLNDTTVYVYNLYNNGNMLNHMYVYDDGTMSFPKQVVFCDDDVEEYNYSPRLGYSGPRIPGNTGCVTADKITWGITIICDGFTTPEGIFKNNRLTFTSGQQFVLGTSSISLMMESILNGECPGDISDLTKQIDARLSDEK